MSMSTSIDDLPAPVKTNTPISTRSSPVYTAPAPVVRETVEMEDTLDEKRDYITEFKDRLFEKSTIFIFVLLFLATTFQSDTIVRSAFNYINMGSSLSGTIITIIKCIGLVMVYVAVSMTSLLE